MADTIKTSKQLKLVAGFNDGDDRTISIDAPRSDITAEEIQALPAESAIVGDKAGAAFKEWKSAAIVETTVTTLDLASA